MIIGRNERLVERIVTHMKSKATIQLNRDGLHPLAAYKSQEGEIPTPWAEKCWKVFLDCDEGVERAIPYVEDNPGKEGKPRQCWPFVVPFLGADVTRF
jgi:hypothetical protein